MSRKITNHEVLTRYRDALLVHFPDQLQRLILFGSQARGDATAESDIDILVVVSWEEEKLELVQIWMDLAEEKLQFGVLKVEGR